MFIVETDCHNIHFNLFTNLSCAGSITHHMVQHCALSCSADICFSNCISYFRGLELERVLTCSLSRYT